MKKNDFILIISVIFIALSVFLFLKFTKEEGSGQVVVKVEGEEFGRYDIDEDNEININNNNILVIKDKKAYIKEATCPDKLCVKQKEISMDGESIICLPNKVVVTVESDSKSDIDAVAN